MNAYTGRIDGGLGIPEIGVAQGADQALAPSGITPTPWGYIVNPTTDTRSGLRNALARFFGVILFMAGLVIGLLPEPSAGMGLIAMKLGAMVVFMLFGGTMVWSGRRRPGAELHVDLSRRLLRIGGRDLYGKFKMVDMLRFEDVRSVYLMRGEGPAAKSRMFLRLDDKVAVEIAQGARDEMERLRGLLTYDLTHRLA